MSAAEPEDFVPEAIPEGEPTFNAQNVKAAAKLSAKQAIVSALGSAIVEEQIKAAKAAADAGETPEGVTPLPPDKVELMPGVVVTKGQATDLFSNDLAKQRSAFQQIEHKIRNVDKRADNIADAIMHNVYDRAFMYKYREKQKKRKLREEELRRKRAAAAGGAGGAAAEEAAESSDEEEGYDDTRPTVSDELVRRLLDINIAFEKLPRYVLVSCKPMSLGTVIMRKGSSEDRSNPLNKYKQAMEELKPRQAVTAAMRVVSFPCGSGDSVTLLCFDLDDLHTYMMNHLNEKRGMHAKFETLEAAVQFLGHEADVAVPNPFYLKEEGRSCGVREWFTREQILHVGDTAEAVTALTNLIAANEIRAVEVEMLIEARERMVAKERDGGLFGTGWGKSLSSFTTRWYQAAHRWYKNLLKYYTIIAFFRQLVCWVLRAFLLYNIIKNASREVLKLALKRIVIPLAIERMKERVRKAAADKARGEHDVKAAEYAAASWFDQQFMTDVATDDPGAAKAMRAAADAAEAREAPVLDAHGKAVESSMRLTAESEDVINKLVDEVVDKGWTLTVGALTGTFWWTLAKYILVSSIQFMWGDGLRWLLAKVVSVFAPSKEQKSTVMGAVTDYADRFISKAIELFNWVLSWISPEAARVVGPALQAFRAAAFAFFRTAPKTSAALLFSYFGNYIIGKAKVIPVVGGLLERGGNLLLACGNVAIWVTGIWDSLAWVIPAAETFWGSFTKMFTNWREADAGSLSDSLLLVLLPNICRVFRAAPNLGKYGWVSRLFGIADESAGAELLDKATQACSATVKSVLGLMMGAKITVMMMQIGTDLWAAVHLFKFGSLPSGGLYAHTRCLTTFDIAALFRANSSDWKSWGAPATGTLSETGAMTKANTALLSAAETGGLAGMSDKNRALISVGLVESPSAFDPRLAGETDSALAAIAAFMNPAPLSAGAVRTAKVSPAKRKASPAKRSAPRPKASPAKRSAPKPKALPAKRRASPAKRRASPAKRKASPAKRKASPAKREASPAKRKASPAKRSAPKRKAAPAKAKASPPKRSASNTKLRRSPRKH